MKKSFSEHRESVYAWDPEQMLEAIMKDVTVPEESWAEKGLLKLVDEIVNNYKVHGGVNWLEGEELPSKQVVTEVLEDFFSIIFPGYLGKSVEDTNMRVFLNNTLHSIYDRLVKEVDKSLKYVCQRVKNCPEDVCLRRGRIVVKELLEKIPEIRVLLKGDLQAAMKKLLTDM